MAPVGSPSGKIKVFGEHILGPSFMETTTYGTGPSHDNASESRFRVDSALRSLAVAGLGFKGFRNFSTCLTALRGLKVEGLG